MNSDIYIFGKLGIYYSQCPDDFTSEIFMKMGEWNTSADTWISVHRKGELMYYGYVRKLDAERHIGFCFVFNGIMITDFETLFEIFDRMVTHLAVGGEILKYNDAGNVISNAQSLIYGKPVLNQIKTLLKDGLSNLPDGFTKLPPESYGISMSESKRFDLHTDDMSAIVSASWNYCYTFVSKDSGIPDPDSYQGILRRLHKERKELEFANSELLTRTLDLEKKKKQQGVVFTLGAVAIICFLILLGVKQSLNETQGDLNRSRFVLEDTQAKLDNTQTNFANAKKQNEEMQSSFLSKMSKKDREIISLQEQNGQLVSDLESLRFTLRQVQDDNSKLNTENYGLKSDNFDLESENRKLKKEIIEYKNSQLTYSNTSSHSSSTTYCNTERIKKATIAFDEASLRKNGDVTAEVYFYLYRGQEIDVFIDSHANGYYKVRYRNTIGYLSDVFIKF